MFHMEQYPIPSFLYPVRDRNRVGRHWYYFYSNGVPFRREFLDQDEARGLMVEINAEYILKATGLDGSWLRCMGWDYEQDSQG